MQRMRHTFMCDFESAVLKMTSGKQFIVHRLIARHMRYVICYVLFSQTKKCITVVSCLRYTIIVKRKKETAIGCNKLYYEIFHMYLRVSKAVSVDDKSL
jgi:hypothetical protein